MLHDVYNDNVKEVCEAAGKDADVQMALERARHIAGIKLVVGLVMGTILIMIGLLGRTIFGTF